MILFGSFGDDPAIDTDPTVGERVFALWGDDAIAGIYGDDRVHAGPGDDEIHLDDAILFGSPWANADRPVIFGGLGHDSVEYNSKDDGEVESSVFGLVKILTLPDSGKTVLMIGVETVEAIFLG